MSTSTLAGRLPAAVPDLEFRLPLGDWVDVTVKWITSTFAWLFDIVKTVLTALFYGEMSEPAPKKEKKSHSTGTAQAAGISKKA